MSNTMKYRGYVASMIFDADDKIIVGRVLDVDDIITFHGESVSEFESNFRTVVDDYIAACESLGAAPEKPASGRLMLRRDLKATVRAKPVTPLTVYHQAALRH